MTKHLTLKEVKPTRQYLRNNTTNAEDILWISLRRRQLCNTRFLRQYSIDHFVVDFYAPKIKLAIELDGDTHFETEEAIEYDIKRQKHIEKLGIVFLRFRNEDVFHHIDDVLAMIENKIKELLSS